VTRAAEKLVYLAGAIEYSPDNGRGWRRIIADFLRHELGHSAYDPAEDERKSLTEEEQLNLRTWKATDFARFQQALRKIIDFDLEIVCRSDYLVCFWDQHAGRGGGTSGELTVAFQHGIPVYLVTPMERASISSWILACSSEIFDNFDLLREYLRKTYGAATTGSAC